MQLRYKNRTPRNIKGPSTPSMTSQNTRFETNKYKCLCSGNHYHPFDTPRLTTTAFAYRSTTVLKHTPYRNSAAFGYPAHRHKLGVKLIKLTTTKPPFVVPTELIVEQEPRLTLTTSPIPNLVKLEIEGLTRLQDEQLASQEEILPTQDRPSTLSLM